MSDLKQVSKRQLERYPLYLKYLESVKAEGVTSISSATIASEFKCSEEQVRKDLQSISPVNAKPGCGRDVDTLIDNLHNVLGYNIASNAIIVGVGNLGSAIMRYQGFKKIGFNVIAGFDADSSKKGTLIDNKPVYSISDLKSFLDRYEVKYAILTVPSEAAQSLVDKLTKYGIKGILNFVPVHLNVSDDIVIENVDLSASLGILSHRLQEKNKGE